MSGINGMACWFPDPEDLAYIVIARWSEFHEFIGDFQPLEYLEFLSLQVRYVFYPKCYF